MTDNLPTRAEIGMSIGYAPIWHEPGWPRYLEQQPHAFATAEVLSAPRVDHLDGPTGGSDPTVTWARMRAVQPPAFWRGLH